MGRQILVSLTLCAAGLGVALLRLAVSRLGFFGGQVSRKMAANAANFLLLTGISLASVSWMNPPPPIGVLVAWDPVLQPNWGATADPIPIELSLGDVPKEWRVCDGENGTPYLNDHLIYGVTSVRDFRHSTFDSEGADGKAHTGTVPGGREYRRWLVAANEGPSSGSDLADAAIESARAAAAAADSAEAAARTAHSLRTNYDGGPIGYKTIFLQKME